MHAVSKSFIILRIIRRSRIIEVEEIFHTYEIHIQIRIVENCIRIVYTFLKRNRIEIIRADISHGVHLKIVTDKRDTP